MKHINILLLSALLFTAVGCAKSNDMNLADPYLTNVTTSDCLMHTDLLAAKDMALDSIAVTIIDGTLSATHYNMMLDCGEGDNIVTSLQLLGDTITVVEDVGEQGLTDCLCLYNNSFQIENLPTRPFTLVIKEVCLYLGDPNQRIVYRHTFI